MSVAINIRIGKNDKARLKEAARLAGMTLSGFLRDAARIEAHKVLGKPTMVEKPSEE